MFEKEIVSETNETIKSGVELSDAYIKKTKTSRKGREAAAGYDYSGSVEELESEDQGFADALSEERSGFFNDGEDGANVERSVVCNDERRPIHKERLVPRDAAISSWSIHSRRIPSRVDHGSQSHRTTPSDNGQLCAASQDRF